MRQIQALKLKSSPSFSQWSGQWPCLGAIKREDRNNYICTFSGLYRHKPWSQQQVVHACLNVPSVWFPESFQLAHWSPWPHHQHPETSKQNNSNGLHCACKICKKNMVQLLTTAEGWDAGAACVATSPAWGLSVAKAASRIMNMLVKPCIQSLKFWSNTF